MRITDCNLGLRLPTVAPDVVSCSSSPDVVLMFSSRLFCSPRRNLRNLSGYSPSHKSVTFWPFSSDLSHRRDDSSSRAAARFMGCFFLKLLLITVPLTSLSFFLCLGVYGIKKAQGGASSVPLLVVNEYFQFLEEPGEAEEDLFR